MRKLHVINAYNVYKRTNKHVYYFNKSLMKCGNFFVE